MERPRISQILRRLMEEVKITEAELARKTDIPQPTLHRILSGSTKSPRGESLSPLANFFSITISQLIGDDELPKDRIPGTYNPGKRGWTTIPVLNWDMVTKWPKLQSDMKRSGWLHWVSTDAEITDDAYGLLVENDSMAPRFGEGTILIIEPSVEPMNRDFVVVHHKNQKAATFKQLLVDGDDRYLRPLNSEFNTAQLDANTRILGVVIQARVDFREQEEEAPKSEEEAVAVD